MKFHKTLGMSSLLLALLLVGCNQESPEALLASAKNHLAQNDFRTASIELKNALQAQPDKAETRFLLAKALLEMGDPVAAEVELKKAKDLGFAEDKLAPLTAKSLLRLGKFKQLFETYGKANYADPQIQADVLTAVGAAYAEQKQHQEARHLFEEAAKLAPEDVMVNLALARQMALSKEYEPAIARLNRLLEKTPDAPDVLKLRGDIERAQGNIEAAKKDYQQAMAAKQVFAPAFAAMVMVALGENDVQAARLALENLKKVAPTELNTRFIEARVLFKEQKLKEARERVAQLLKDMPDNPSVMELAGIIDYRLDNLTQAEAQLAKVVQASDEHLDARSFLISTYLRRGQLDKATAALQPVLGSMGNNPTLLGLAGDIAMRKGELVVAEKYFAKAAQLDPANLRRQTSLAWTHVAKGGDQGVDELTRIAESDQGVSADLALISAHINRKSYDKALQALTGLEKKHQGALAAEWRGRIQLLQNQPEEARKSFESVLQQSPGHVPASLQLAQLDISNGKPALAKKRYETLLTADPANLAVLQALQALSRDDPEGMIARLQKALQAKSDDPALATLLTNAYLEHGDKKLALDLAQNAAARFPDEPDVFEVLGRAFVANGDMQQAITAYNKMQSLQPDSVAPHLRLAQVAIVQKNPTSAEKSLRRALELKPDLFDAYRGLALLALDRNDVPTAYSLAREFQKKNPKSVSGYLLEADIAIAKKQWEVAVTALRSGLKQGPKIELAVKLDKALRASGAKVEADKFSSEWAKAHPDVLPFRLHQADVALQNGQPEVAMQHYKAILARNPDHVLALNNLASLLVKSDPKQALSLAEQAVAKAPKEAAIADTLAEALIANRQPEKAIEVMKPFASGATVLPGVRMNLAKAYLAAGDKAAAKKQLEALSTLGDRYPKQAEVKQLLNGL